MGGLFLDQGLEAVQKWLDLLLRPYTQAAYQIVRQQHGLPAIPTGPLPSRYPQLNGKVGTAGSYSGSRNGQPDEAPTTPAGGYLALFNQCLQKGNKQVEWTFDDGRSIQDEEKGNRGSLAVIGGRKATPVWVAHVWVDGELYGQGKGTTKQLAKNEAAKQGLDKMGIIVV